MTCPGCLNAMDSQTLDATLGGRIEIDVCATCQAFWFDQYESLHLAPGSTLRLMKFIGEHSSPVKPLPLEGLRCPRCATTLRFTRDLQRNTPFSYWRCVNEDGRFIGFFDFLKEKSFIRALTPQQIAQLRENVQTMNCSSCGAAIDLKSDSACPFCHSPLSMIDMKQPQLLLAQLQQAAAAPHSVAVPKLNTDATFGLDQQGWTDALASGLVQAGLKIVTSWFEDSWY